MEKCSLCLIPKKENKRLIHSTEYSFSCIIVEPLHNSHLLVMPKRHVENLNEISVEEAKDLFEHLDYLSSLLKEKFTGRGVIISLHNHELKTQKHIHFHIMAIDAGIRDLVSKYLNVDLRKRLPDNELQKLADNIKE